MIPEAQFLDSQISKKFRSFYIVLDLIRQSVLKTIQFDRQLCHWTIEIEEVITDLMLAAKFESGEPPGF